MSLREKPPLIDRVDEVRDETIRSVLRAGAGKPIDTYIGDLYTPRAIELLTDHILDLQAASGEARGE